MEIDLGITEERVISIKGCSVNSNLENHRRQSPECTGKIWMDNNPSITEVFISVKAESGQKTILKVVTDYMIVCDCTFSIELIKEYIITRISISFNYYKYRDRCHYLNTLIIK